jgi:hypothetical protein
MTMAKGNNRRGNREAKKPKKTKEKIVATAGFPKSETPIKTGNKKPN